jgi:hypothetical protein
MSKTAITGSGLCAPDFRPAGMHGVFAEGRSRGAGPCRLGRPFSDEPESPRIRNRHGQLAIGIPRGCAADLLGWFTS